MLPLNRKISLTILLLFFPLLASAAIPTDRSMDAIVDGFINASARWESVIATHAHRLFFLLAVIDFAWMSMMMLFRKVDIMEFMGQLIQRVMVIGFFLILLNQGTNWASLVVSSFRELAEIAGGVKGISPSTVMDNGIKIAVNLIDSQSGWDVAAKIIAGIISLGILLVFVLLTAELIVVLISTYIILTAGVIMLAFGGSNWTQQFAVNYYKTALALGVRLFIIQLLIGLGVSLINGFVAQISDTASLQEMFVIFASVLVLYVLVQSISALVQSLISGSGDTSTGGTGALVGAGVGAATAMASMSSSVGDTAKSTVGAASAVSSASALASQALSEGSSGISQTFGRAGAAMGGSTGKKMGESLGLGLSKVAGTITELGKAGIADYGSRVKGELGAESGSMGGRMSARMDSKAELQKMQDAGSGEGADNYISGVPHKGK